MSILEGFFPGINIAGAEERQAVVQARLWIVIGRL
jgi:hypothetical protein